MMRMVTAASAICATLLLAWGMFGSTPAEAGYYHGGGYGYGSYYGPRPYYGYRTGYYRPYYRPYHRPYYGPYYRPYYADYGYYNGGHGGYGYGCNVAYIPYGWTWYRATSC